MTNAFDFKFTNPLVDEDDDEGPEKAATPSQNGTSATPGHSPEPTPEPLPSQTDAVEPWTNPLRDDEDEEDYSGQVSAHRSTHAAETAAGTPVAKRQQAAKRRKPPRKVVKDGLLHSTNRKKVYNRKLLNKHDYELLAFLAVVKVANTRILGLATGKTDRQVQQRLKGLQELGLTDNRLMVGTQAIWVVTPRGVRALQKKSLLYDRPFVTGTRLEHVKNSSIGHKLAEATVAAQLLIGSQEDSLGLLTWQNLIHENEISAAFSRARVKLDYRHDVRPSDVHRGLEKWHGQKWEGFDLAWLYLARREFGSRPDHTKIPDLVAQSEHGRMAVEVELYPKDYRDYLEIVETYRLDLTYSNVLYVVLSTANAITIMEAALEVHGAAKRNRIDSPDMWGSAPKDGRATAKVQAEQRRIAEDFGQLDSKFMVKPLYDALGNRFTGDPWQL